MKKIKTLSREKLFHALDVLIKKYRLLAPVKDDNILTFAEVKKSSEIIMDFTNSVGSPKKIFFPQSETIISYSRDGIRHVPEYASEKKRIVFGMRPCDAKALTLLDKVFDSPDYKDPYYVEKRKNTTIFSLACGNPQMSCFCTSVGLGPFSKAGSDIFLVDLGEKFLLEPVTDKGNIMLNEISGMQESEEKDLAIANELQSGAESKIKRHVQLDGLAKKLDDIFDHAIWSEIHEKCLGCGICTYLCPTCHCFDIEDEAVDGKGRRVRNWDSCMFPRFTLEASGHNPRPTNRERMRHRIMHKFNYFVKNYGLSACVGCGRCIRNCPAGMDILEVIKQLGSAE